MILYDYRCQECSHAFEAAVASMSAPNPPCACGGPTQRIITTVALGGVADTGPSRGQMPKSWQATRGGDPETIRHWHKLATTREKLEERHPELGGDRRPILAHEGIFANRPLRAGDNIGKAVQEATKSHTTGADQL